MDKSDPHHADAHEAFDPEPVQRLSAEETPSPAWLPVVGGGLLLLAAGWAFYPGAGASRPPEAPPPVAPAAAAPAPTAAPALPRPRPSGAKPDGSARLRPTRMPTRPTPSAP